MIKILHTEFKKFDGLGIITPSINPMLFSYADHGSGVQAAAICRAEYIFNDYLKRLKTGINIEKIDPHNYKSLFGLGKYRIRVFNSQSPMMMWEDFLDELPIIGSIYSPQYALFDKGPKILHENYRGTVQGITVYHAGTMQEHYEMITFKLDSKFG